MRKATGIYVHNFGVKGYFNYHNLHLDFSTKTMVGDQPINVASHVSLQGDNGVGKSSLTIGISSIISPSQDDFKKISKGKHLQEYCRDRDTNLPTIFAMTLAATEFSKEERTLCRVNIRNREGDGVESMFMKMSKTVFENSILINPDVTYDQISNWASTMMANDANFFCTEKQHQWENCLLEQCGISQTAAKLMLGFNSQEGGITKVLDDVKNERDYLTRLEGFAINEEEQTDIGRKLKLANHELQDLPRSRKGIEIFTKMVMHTESYYKATRDLNGFKKQLNEFLVRGGKILHAVNAKVKATIGEIKIKADLFKEEEKFKKDREAEVKRSERIITQFEFESLSREKEKAEKEIKEATGLRNEADTNYDAIKIAPLVRTVNEKQASIKGWEDEIAAIDKDSSAAGMRKQLEGIAATAYAFGLFLKQKLDNDTLTHEKALANNQKKHKDQKELLSKTTEAIGAAKGDLKSKQKRQEQAEIELNKLDAIPSKVDAEIAVNNNSTAIKELAARIKGNAQKRQDAAELRAKAETTIKHQQTNIERAKNTIASYEADVKALKDNVVLSKLEDVNDPVLAIPVIAAQLKAAQANLNRHQVELKFSEVTRTNIETYDVASVSEAQIKALNLLLTNDIEAQPANQYLSQQPRKEALAFAAKYPAHATLGLVFNSSSDLGRAKNILKRTDHPLILFAIGQKDIEESVSAFVTTPENRFIDMPSAREYLESPESDFARRQAELNKAIHQQTIIIEQYDSCLDAIRALESKKHHADLAKEELKILERDVRSATAQIEEATKALAALKDELNGLEANQQALDKERAALTKVLLEAQKKESLAAELVDIAAKLETLGKQLLQLEQDSNKVKEDINTLENAIIANKGQIDACKRSLSEFSEKFSKLPKQSKATPADGNFEVAYQRYSDLYITLQNEDKVKKEPIQRKIDSAHVAIKEFNSVIEKNSPIVRERAKRYSDSGNDLTVLEEELQAIKTNATNRFTAASSAVAVSDSKFNTFITKYGANFTRYAALDLDEQLERERTFCEATKKNVADSAVKLDAIKKEMNDLESYKNILIQYANNLTRLEVDEFIDEVDAYTINDHTGEEIGELCNHIRQRKNQINAATATQSQARRSFDTALPLVMDIDQALHTEVSGQIINLEKEDILAEVLDTFKSKKTFHEGRVRDMESLVENQLVPIKEMLETVVRRFCLPEKELHLGKHIVTSRLSNLLKPQSKLGEVLKRLVYKENVFADMTDRAVGKKFILEVIFNAGAEGSNTNPSNPFDIKLFRIDGKSYHAVNDNKASGGETTAICAMIVTSMAARHVTATQAGVRTHCSMMMDNPFAKLSNAAWSEAVLNHSTNLQIQLVCFTDSIDMRKHVAFPVIYSLEKDREPDANGYFQVRATRGAFGDYGLDQHA